MRIVTALIVYNIFILAEPGKQKFHPKPKIVGGEPADIRDCPYQISLQYEHYHVCGAVILSTTHALTAAHCYEGQPVNQFNVRAGSIYTNSGGQEVKLTVFLQHSNYNKAAFDFDLAMLQFQTALQFDQSISAITIPNEDLSVPGGRRGTVTGWGHQYQGGIVSNTLLKALIPITTRETCSQVYGRVGVTVTERMFCAGGEAQRGICQGDSGGPLTVDGVLVGISSATIGCGLENLPALFSNVFDQLGWIRQQANL